MARADDRLREVTRPGGSQLFYDTAGSTDKTRRPYEGYYHDLLHDVGNEKVLADITDWIHREGLTCMRVDCALTAIAESALHRRSDWHIGCHPLSYATTCVGPSFGCCLRTSHYCGFRWP